MCPQHLSLWTVLDCRHLFLTALLALLLYLCLVATSGLGPGPAYREARARAAASRVNIVTHAALPDITGSRCEHTAPLTVAVAGIQVSSPVSALVCQKEGDTMISAALHRDGSWEAGLVTAMLSAVASYPEAVFIGTQCLVTPARGVLVSLVCCPHVTCDQTPAATSACTPWPWPPSAAASWPST